MSSQKEQASFEDGIAEINQKITEIKKRIQLSEGQRKAHFEECGAEKKRNLERIGVLKKEVKEIYQKLAEPSTCQESILKTNNRYTNDAGALRNKKLEDAIEFMDLKCIDLNKKLDVFKFKNKMKNIKLKKLAEEYRDLVNGTDINLIKKKEKNVVGNKLRCSLENEIHRMEMNLMEAEHVNKKYKSIRLHLLSDSVEFESTLKKLEKEIEKQNLEIQKLQVINKEALELRDQTKGNLLRNEIFALNAGKSRDNQLQEFRQRVEEKKLELEKLEKRIFPAGRIVFDEGDEVAIGVQAGESANQLLIKLESAFAKLKTATGETEIEDVLTRFISQKETKQRLEFLKRIAEEEKKQLELRKEISLAELEASKFSEVKEREQSQEELEKLQREIEFHKNVGDNYSKELDRIKGQLLGIRNCLSSVIQELQEMNEEPPPKPSEDVATIEEVVNCLVRKIQSGLGRIGLGKNLRETMKILDQSQQQQAIPTSIQIPREEIPLFPGLIQQGEGTKSKIQQPSLLVPDTEDEEEIPSRIFLKRQAQLIVDAKSRKKFSRVLNFPKPKK